MSTTLKSIKAKKSTKALKYRSTIKLYALNKTAKQEHIFQRQILEACSESYIEGKMLLLNSGRYSYTVAHTESIEGESIRHLYVYKFKHENKISKPDLDLFIRAKYALFNIENNYSIR